MKTQKIIKKTAKKAFTLAEVMIVLTVIGILSAILMPAAFKSAPDENVLKFKKAHANLYKAIRELTSNGRFYKEGDLGLKPFEYEYNPDLTYEEGEAAKDATYRAHLVTDTKYFCNTLADILDVKKVDCDTAYGAAKSYIDVRGANNVVDLSKIKTVANTNVDARCAAVQADTIKADKQIVTSDGVVWFEESSNTPFGVYETETTRLFSDSNGRMVHHQDSTKLLEFESLVNKADSEGFDAAYKVFCIDVDGYSGPEAPFGYGIRADGLIQTGARADEWIAKTVQKQ